MREKKKELAGARVIDTSGENFRAMNLQHT